MSYAGKSPIFSSVTVEDSTVVYFGDSLTDGSFRIIKDGATLKIEVRDTGVWVTKDTIEG